MDNAALNWSVWLALQKLQGSEEPMPEDFDRVSYTDDNIIFCGEEIIERHGLHYVRTKDNHHVSTDGGKTFVTGETFTEACCRALVRLVLG